MVFRWAPGSHDAGFLTALGACAAYLALTNTVGCELLGRTSKLTSLRLPRVGPLRTPKVWPLPSVSPPPEEGVWAFRSRPELSPAAVEVTTTQAHGDTAPGYVFVALKEGAGEHGPMIIDDQGQLVWFGKYRSREGLQDAVLPGRARAHLVGGQGRGRARRRRVRDLRRLLP